MRDERWIITAALAVTWGVGCATPPKAQRNAWPERMSRARRLMAGGDHAAAAARLREMIQSNPRHAEAHYFLAHCHVRLGDEALAIEGFRAAIGLDENLIPAYYNLGTLYLRRADHELARHWLELAVKRDPDHVPSYTNLAKAYYRTGRPDLAGPAYEEALDRDPNNQVALEAMALLCSAAREPDLAKRYCQRFAAVCTDPERVEALRAKLRPSVRAKVGPGQKEPD